MSERPCVAISSCLLGHLVRYDGTEKRVSWIADVLAGQVEVIAICPEVGAGMPVPRPPIRVVRDQGALRLQVVGSGQDVTDAVQTFIDHQLTQMVAAPIDGYVFKARSPSCGLYDTPHFTDTSAAASSVDRGSGLWAAAIRRQFRTIPVVDESEVVATDSQETFLKRVWSHWRGRVA